MIVRRQLAPPGPSYHLLGVPLPGMQVDLTTYPLCVLCWPWAARAWRGLLSHLLPAPQLHLVVRVVCSAELGTWQAPGEREGTALFPVDRSRTPHPQGTNADSPRNTGWHPHRLNVPGVNFTLLIRHKIII